ncbi:MAG: DUF11 domain-containing protein [Thermoleophilia bacterium]|nr:DUF11 domain-containing protein [Thermoleophilia bacterium]
MIVVTAALALGVLLVTPAFGLRQKLVDVLSPQSLGPVFGKRDQATSARGESTRPPSEATRPQGKRVSVPGDSAVERTARAERPPSARRRRTARRPLSPRGAGAGGVVAGEPKLPTAARGRRSADLSVRQTVSEHPVQIGHELTRWVVVRNRGPHAAAGVVLRTSIPAGAAAPVVTTQRGTCTTGPTEAVCTIGAVARARTVTVRIVARAPVMPTRLVATASVSARTSDPRSANDAATVTTLVRGGFVRGRGLVSYRTGVTTEVDVDAVATVGLRGETGRGIFSYRSTGPWDILISGRVTCLILGDDGRVASIAGVVDVAAYGPSSLEFDPMDTVSVGAGARLGFVDTGAAGAGDRLGHAFGFPPLARCPTASEPPFFPMTGPGGLDVLTEGDFEVGFATP